MLSDLPVLNRDQFTKVRGRIAEIVEQAKQDMEILEEMQPRRFFYAKHFLALRYMVAIKLEKLEQFALEGWVPIQDMEELRESLVECLHELEVFHPKVAANTHVHMITHEE